MEEKKLIAAKRSEDGYSITNDDEVYHLKECTGGVYIDLKLNMLNSVTTGAKEKIQIIDEFKLADINDQEGLRKYLDEIKKDEKDIPVFYTNAASIIFMEEPEVKFAVLNLREMNRAINDFFSSLNAN